MNFVCLVAVISAANSAIYASSRSLMALSREGHAPAFLAKTSKAGVPIYAIALTTCFASIAFLGSFFGEGKIFRELIKLMGLSIMIIWLLICFTHIRFR
jgi:lysine-specific permease